MKTYGSLFTGGGLADIGARMAGLTPVWGVEYDSAIAAVAQQNDPSGTVHAMSVCDIDYAALPRVDVLHASPPCPNFSVAKTGAVETPQDLALADAVCRAIQAQRPALFTLENVRGYAGSQSLARIQATLFDLDYHVTTVVINAADYLVPQTRERLFLIAHAGGWMQASRPLPPAQPWRGWYGAIADLIPTLPESAFAPWQLARLPEDVRESVMPSIVNGDGTTTPRTACEPAFTLQATADRNIPRAFILDCQENGSHDGARGATQRDTDEPCFTVTAQSGTKRPARAWLVNEDSKMGIVADDEPAFTQVSAARALRSRAWLASGRVVAMTPRALARFQSVPDSYVLPEKKALACRIIGNGVACAAYAALLASQLEHPHGAAYDPITTHGYTAPWRVEAPGGPAWFGTLEAVRAWAERRER